MSSLLDAIYYVYYDKESGNILSVTNETHSFYQDFIEIPFDSYERLVSGIDKFSDYRVGAKLDGSMGLVLLEEDRYNFKNKLLTWIDSEPNSKTDFIIEWHYSTQVWKFSLSDYGKLRLIKDAPQVISFFVTLHSDFDFLVRTFEINVPELFIEDIYIPFKNKFENDITQLEIAIKTGNFSYGLAILNE